MINIARLHPNSQLSPPVQVIYRIGGDDDSFFALNIRERLVELSDRGSGVYGVAGVGDDVSKASAPDGFSMRN